MGMMKRVATAAVLVSLAACVRGDAGQITAPDQPAFDAGVGFGSGHRGDTIPTTNATAQEGSGVGFGSGH